MAKFEIEISDKFVPLISGMATILQVSPAKIIQTLFDETLDLLENGFETFIPQKIINQIYFKEVIEDE